MSRPRRKRVTDEVMQKIIIAIEEIEADAAAPRTKREVEHRTGLSHDAVARAFRQDAEEENTWNISQRLSDLTEDGANRRSPARRQQLSLEDTIRDLRQRLAEAEQQQHRYAMALYAYQLSSGEASEPSRDVVPMGRNRSRRET